MTFNCGTISGGTGVNVIADRCAFAFEVRHTVDHDPDVVVAAVHARRRPRARRPRRQRGSVERHRDHPLSSAAHTSADPWLRLVERIADAGPAGAIGYGTEGGLFAEALDVPVVICGPGDIAVAHRPDEYVTVDQLLRCERFLVRPRPTALCRCARRGLDLGTMENTVTPTIDETTDRLLAARPAAGQHRSISLPQEREVHDDTALLVDVCSIDSIWGKEKQLAEFFAARLTEWGCDDVRTGRSRAPAVRRSAPD